MVMKARDAFKVSVGGKEFTLRFSVSEIRELKKLWRLKYQERPKFRIMIIESMNDMSTAGVFDMDADFVAALIFSGSASQRRKDPITHDEILELIHSDVDMNYDVLCLKTAQAYMSSIGGGGLYAKQLGKMVVVYENDVIPAIEEAFSDDEEEEVEELEKETAVKKTRQPKKKSTDTK